MSPETRRAFWATVWRQLPFLIWLVVVWMLLWGQFTVLALVSGIVVSLTITRIFRLPPVEMSGRVNLWYLLVFIVSFLASVVWGSLQVAVQVLNPRRYPGTAVIAVPLRTDDDLIMTHVGVTASLIPGSLVLEIDRDRRIIYLHVLGIDDDADVAALRESVLGWERRIVLALGSKAQVAQVRSRGGAPRGVRA